MDAKEAIELSIRISKNGITAENQAAKRVESVLRNSETVESESSGASGDVESTARAWAKAIDFFRVPKGKVVSSWTLRDAAGEPNSARSSRAGQRTWSYLNRQLMAFYMPQIRKLSPEELPMLYTEQITVFDDQNGYDEKYPDRWTNLDCADPQTGKVYHVHQFGAAEAFYNAYALMRDLDTVGSYLDLSFPCDAQAYNKYLNDDEIDNGQSATVEEDDEVDDIYEDDDRPANPLDASLNLIFFGAPGTGKSYEMNRMVTSDFPRRSERVTFYADYQHAQFVGAYKPVTVGGQIEYRFRPGPFTRVLVKALNNPQNNYALVIEELNRAEAASVFGDLFQLLDRSDAGMSEYPVSTSEDLREFLNDPDNGNNGGLSSTGKDNLVSQIAEVTGSDVSPDDVCAQIVIPRNMYIWATMNSADQGVYPLDTAFKRRWDFRYVGIDEGETEIQDPVWKENRRAINQLLLKEGVNEDKQLGPFFIKRSLDFTKNRQAFDEAFRNKVLMYLFEDAAKYHRGIFDIDAIRKALPIQERDGVDAHTLSLHMLFAAWDAIDFGLFHGMQSTNQPDDTAAVTGQNEPVSVPEEIFTA